MADRFDGLSRAASDADEALDPTEEAFMESGSGAPESESEDTEEPFARGGADSVAPHQHLVPAEYRRQKPAPMEPDEAGKATPARPAGPAPKQSVTPPAAKASAQPSQAQISEAIADAAGRPKPQPSPEVSPEVAPMPDAPVIADAAALRWQRPNFGAIAEQALADARRQDPEPPKDERTAHLEWQLRENDRRMQGMQIEREISAVFDSGTRALDYIERQEAEWTASHPDYHARVVFVGQRRDRDLQRMGYGDPNVRQRILGQEATMVIAQALRQGRNPAQVLHDLADLWGYNGQT